MKDFDEGLQICAVEVFHLKKDLKSEMRISRGGFKVREHALVQLHTRSGLVGLGEGIGNASQISNVLSSFVAHKALEFSANEMSRWKQTWSYEPTYFEQLGTVSAAVSAVEMAMWDIYGKALNRPCYELFGGAARKSLPAYASDIYWQHDIDAMRREAHRIRSLGYSKIKAHLGVLPPREESLRVKAIRDEIGSDADLMIDLNCGYDLRAAKEAIGRGAEHRLYWLEEPLQPEYNFALAELMSGAQGIPIALGENSFSPADFSHLASLGAIDVLMPDVGRVGGISTLRDIAAVGKSFGRLVSPHNFSSGVLLAATAHAICGSYSMDLIEIDTSGNAVYEELLESGWTISGGTIQISEAPGLGVVLQASTLERHCIKSERIEQS